MATYYSPLKFLHFKNYLAGIEQGEIVAPVHIRVKPTNHCNHNCWYCAYRADNLDLGDKMVLKDSIPTDRVLALTHEFVSVGVKAITFSGGEEPILYKPLLEVIEILAAGGVQIASLTNGSNLKGRVADAFAAHGTWIRISQDALDDEGYAKSHGAKGRDFSRLIENIRNFTARKTQCVIGVSMIVGHDNHQHILEVGSLLKDCVVNHVKVSGAAVSNGDKGNNSYHLTIKNEVKRQIEAAQALTNKHFSVLNQYHDLEDHFEKQYETCPFLQFLTVVGADQHVYTCQDKAYTQSEGMGSITTRSFIEFWFSEEWQQFLKTFDRSAQCGHHCVSQAKNLAIHEHLSLEQKNVNFV